MDWEIQWKQNLVLFLVWIKTDLFADLVLALDESFKKIREITKKFESSQFGLEEKT